MVCEFLVKKIDGGAGVANSILLEWKDNEEIGEGKLGGVDGQWHQATCKITENSDIGSGIEIAFVRLKDG